jgi:hypothetical protein
MFKLLCVGRIAIFVSINPTAEIIKVKANIDAIIFVLPSL